MSPTTPTIFNPRSIHHILVLTHFHLTHCIQIFIYHQTNLYQFPYVGLNVHFSHHSNYGFVACTHSYLSINHYLDFMGLNCCRNLQNQATNFHFRPSGTHANNCINLFHLIFLTIGS